MKHGSTWWTRPLPLNFNLLRLRYNTWLNKHVQQLADTLLHLHSHTEKTAQREEPKRISSRHSATEVCRMNSSPTSPVTQHTDQQTNQTNQKHWTKKYDIETWLLVKTFAKTTSMQEPENTNCFNSRPRRLLNTKTSNTQEQTIWILQITHDPS